MRIAFHKDGVYGSINYDEGNQDVLVAHPDSRVRNTIYNYLTTKRPFDVCMSSHPNERGGYVQVDKIPTKHKDYMEMALAEMHFNTGVSVDWNHPNNRTYESTIEANGGQEEGV